MKHSFHFTIAIRNLPNHPLPNHPLPPPHGNHTYIIGVKLQKPYCDIFKNRVEDYPHNLGKDKNNMF